MEELKFKLNLQLFGEDPEPNKEGDPQPNEDQDYLDTIHALQEKLKNSVEKEEYDKVVERNKKMKEIIISGKGELGEEVEEKVDIDELRRELFNPENQLDNLTYVSDSLKLRKAILKRDGKDIFSSKPEEDRDAVETAEALQDCVDKANGDSNVFTALLQGILVDDPRVSAIVLKNKAKRR